MEESKEIDITRKHDVTIEELRAHYLFANFTDDQLIEATTTIKKLTEIAFSFYLKKIAPRISLSTTRHVYSRVLDLFVAILSSNFNYMVTMNCLILGRAGKGIGIELLMC